MAGKRNYTWGISKKIWLSLSILIVGYLGSMVYGFIQGRQTEVRLKKVSEAVFPATIQCLSALKSFKEQVKLYEGAVVYGEESLLETALTKSKEPQKNLEAVIAIPGISEALKSKARNIKKELSDYSEQAYSLYSEMSRGVSSKVYLQKSGELDRQAIGLQEKLSSLSDAFTRNLKSELSGISRLTRNQRFLNMTFFIVVVSVVLVLVSIIVNRLILRPLTKTVTLANNMANGDLSQKLDILQQDEIGELAQAMNIMAEKIEKSHSELEQKVIDRTDILRKTNKKLTEEVLERERAEKALHQAKESAETANKVKSVFLANMSHEIRTPMNGVIGMIDLLLSMNLTKDQEECVETIKTSADSLLTIINDILDFSKIEAGKLELEAIDFDLRTTLEDMSEFMALRAHEKGVELVCLIEHEVPSLLCGDPGRLRQVLVNLVGNAVKFTKSGEIVLHVAVDQDLGDRVVLRFSVKDTGVGIPSGSLQNLFKAFTQADGSTTRKYGGTGLGLTISKQLVEMMGGQIGVESWVEKGSMFWFTANLEKQPQAREVMMEMNHSASLEGMKILVVDDNAASRNALLDMLAFWKCRCDIAPGAKEAFEALKKAARAEDPFKIAILDMCMPEIGGEALGKMIKGEPLIQGTELVVLTSVGERGDAARLAKEGFAAFLTKPVKKSHFFECLMSIAGERKAADKTENQIITRHTVVEKRKQKIRILLVEDNLVNQKVGVKLLQNIGYRADTASNGLEAIKAIEAQNYDLVLMDIQMPEMDGVEATQHIRDLEKKVQNPKVPIIALTAHAMKGDREKYIEAGMDDYIPKPIRPQILAETLERWIGKESGQKSSA